MIGRIVLNVLVGGMLGYGWYRLAGCSAGACPLTSNPVTSALWGASLGLLLALG